ncbi:unnamed protein product [Penicillium bialowiezense]
MDLFQGDFLSALWDKVPGDSLSEKYFWDLERDACNAIRREFRRVNEKVIYDQTSGSIQICGFDTAACAASSGASCVRCQRGFGPFPLCIVSACNGACANCLWASRDHRTCSIVTESQQTDSSAMYRENLSNTEQFVAFRRTRTALDTALAQNPINPATLQTAWQAHMNASTDLVNLVDSIRW